uniref:N-acyl homoserine lactonase (AHL-lactonase) (Acyl-homoserine lactonase) (EC) n=1 Tax=Ganoderma boninense TaxID=34458 RepID=A0A5K1K669_9APHY|nr:N-acyl homoserine lactonase (AHL-lactonase) (Acyl-homoserine lactonase) (EC [Ganoderma boninense]
MPARTLPDHSLDHPALSPPRFFPRFQPQVLSSHPHRDTHDERFPDYNAYALPMPPHNPRPDQDYAAHSSWSPPLRVYPEPSSIPPHWQPHPPNPSHYRDPRPYVSPPPIQPNPRAPWQTVNPYARVLQVQPFASHPASHTPQGLDP